MPSSYVDRLQGLTTSVAIKAPVRVATTENIALSGLQSIDDVTVVTGDRVLVKNQNTVTENGIYVADTSNWSRAKDFDGAGDAVKGTRVWVIEGSTLAGQEWSVSTANPVVIGTSSITFAHSPLQDAVEAAEAAQAAAEAAAATLDLPEIGSGDANKILVVLDTEDGYGLEAPATARATLGAAGLADANTFTSNNTFEGDDTHSGTSSFTGPVSLGDGSEVTISGGQITPTAPYHQVDTESDAASDDLDTILLTNIGEGGIFLMHPAHTDRTVVVKHGTGNIRTSDAADIVLDTAGKAVAFQRRGSLIHEIFRAAAPISRRTPASASGTAVDFTGIPSGVKRIVVQFFNVSTNGTSPIIVQIGGSGGIETSSYSGAASTIGSTVSTTAYTDGFGISSGIAATQVYFGTVTLTFENNSSNRWLAAAVLARSDAALSCVGSGGKALSTILDRVRITTQGGSDTFDSGEFNLMYE